MSDETISYESEAVGRRPLGVMPMAAFRAARPSSSKGIIGFLVSRGWVKTEHRAKVALFWTFLAASVLAIGVYYFGNSGTSKTATYRIPPTVLQKLPPELREKITGQRK